MPTLESLKLENSTLYYREGTSDKVYQCAVETAGGRFAVTSTNSEMAADNAMRRPTDCRTASSIANAVMASRDWSAVSASLGAVGQLMHLFFRFLPSHLYFE